MPSFISGLNKSSLARAALVLCSIQVSSLAAQPFSTLDLLGEDPTDGQIQRMLGTEASGRWGVPVTARPHFCEIRLTVAGLPAATLLAEVNVQPVVEQA